MSEREEVKPIECDCCGGTWGYINDEGEHDNVWTCVHELTNQRDAMKRERDEARAAIGTLRELAGCRSRNVGDVDMPTHTREIMEAVRHRAERAERVVQLLRIASVLPSPDLLTYGDWADLCEAVRALDAEAQP